MPKSKRVPACLLMLVLLVCWLLVCWWEVLAAGVGALGVVVWGPGRERSFGGAVVGSGGAGLVAVLLLMLHRDVSRYMFNMLSKHLKNMLNIC